MNTIETIQTLASVALWVIMVVFFIKANKASKKADNQYFEERSAHHKTLRELNESLKINRELLEYIKNNNNKEEKK